MKFSLAVISVLLSAQAFAQNNYGWGGMPMGEINFPEIKSKFGLLAPKPENRITGQDLIDNHKPLPLELFQKLYFPEGGSEYEIKDAYKKYDMGILNRRFADILMARILDFKALEAKIEPTVSDLRVVYVMRTVLIQNWRFVKGKDTPIPKSNDEMYELFKSRVGNNPVRFTRDWKICEPDMNYICDSFKKDQFALPQLTLSFQSLPATVTDFMIGIRERLQPSYLKVVRAQVMQGLVSGLAPKFMAKAQENPNFAEMNAVYERIKDPQFKIYNFKVNFAEVVIEGDKTVDVEGYMNAYFQDKLSSAMQVANQEKDPAKRKALILLQRKEIRAGLLAGLAKNFPDVVVKERVVADQFAEGEETKSEFPHDKNFLAQEYPLLRVKNEKGIRLVMALDIEAIDLGFKTVNQVLPDLQDFVKNKYAVAGFRATIYKLFSTYTLSKEWDTCKVDHIPCNEVDPMTLTQMMFREESFIKSSPSSITDITSMHKALNISAPDLEAIYNVKLNNLKPN